VLIALVNVALRWRRYFPGSSEEVEAVANCAVPSGVSPGR
jgi:hypothetical protein